MKPVPPGGVSTIGGSSACWSSRCKLALAGAALVVIVAAPVHAATAQSPPATIETTIRDPWVPPELRTPAPTPATQGAALRAQVERKLRQAFDAADLSHSGSLTRQQANAGGLGFVARHFDEIDRQKSGAVRFEDVKRYMVERGAKLE